VLTYMVVCAAKAADRTHCCTVWSIQVASAAREVEVQKASLRSHIEGLVARGVTDGLGPFITALTGVYDQHFALLAS
jgi:hypothetical protein